MSTASTTFLPFPPPPTPSTSLLSNSWPLLYCCCKYTCVYMYIPVFTTYWIHLALLICVMFQGWLPRLVNPGENWFSVIYVDIFFFAWAAHSALLRVYTLNLMCQEVDLSDRYPKLRNVNSDPSQQSLNLTEGEDDQRCHSTNLSRSFLPNPSRSMTKAWGFSWSWTSGKHHHNLSWPLAMSERKLTILLSAKRGSGRWQSTETKLKLLNVPSGLISYRVTFNCCFFLSNFNPNVSRLLSPTSLNN